YNVVPSNVTPGGGTVDTVKLVVSPLKFVFVSCVHFPFLVMAALNQRFVGKNWIVWQDDLESRKTSSRINRS
ncbi:hypothetical protein M405DRAFT_807715, partial [Rhizopogon salebrosus TDB-379]